MSGKEKKAVVLLSGGIDSAVCAALAREQGYALNALTVDYGQKNRFEIQAAGEIARLLGAGHLVINTALDSIKGSALTDPEIDIPRGESEDIPVTYVPARNLILLSLGVSWAEVLGAEAVFIGAAVRDYSGYPDCREEFLKSFEKTVSLGTREETRISVEAPLLNMDKAEIVREGMRLGVDISLTSSCYNPSDKGTPCGECSSCIQREKGIRGAGGMPEEDKDER